MCYLKSSLLHDSAQLFLQKLRTESDMGVFNLKDCILSKEEQEYREYMLYLAGRHTFSMKFKICLNLVDENAKGLRHLEHFSIDSDTIYPNRTPSLHRRSQEMTLMQTGKLTTLSVIEMHGPIFSLGGGDFIEHEYVTINGQKQLVKRVKHYYFDSEKTILLTFKECMHLPIQLEMLRNAYSNMAKIFDMYLDMINTNTTQYPDVDFRQVNANNFIYLEKMRKCVNIDVENYGYLFTKQEFVPIFTTFRKVQRELGANLQEFLQVSQ